MLTHYDPQVFYKIKKFLGFGQILHYKTKPIICCNTISSSFKQHTKDKLIKKVRATAAAGLQQGSGPDERKRSGKEKSFSQLSKREQILNISASGSKNQPKNLVHFFNIPSSIKHKTSHEIKYFKFQILDLKGL